MYMHTQVRQCIVTASDNKGDGVLQSYICIEGGCEFTTTNVNSEHRVDIYVLDPCAATYSKNSCLLGAGL